ncbi:hypothetical protein WJX81_002169 [Elliptochloris bilobata]|uniref:Pirin N-terminal domain-containing protein n=1 Tax=Elliptochloris bilobata TaxID=381761 RepID=A0AAW1RMZ8_9CHLO
MAGYVRHIPSTALHVSKPTWWLESRFHFSFADYHNPSRTAFGVLRVLNDDLVKGKSGFGKHPHRDAEIFSYVVDGRLTHQDSLGNSEALGRGAVQYMSAGTGVVHSELNDAAEMCHFVQTWITPDRRGHAPQYGSAQFAPGDRRNRLLHILGGTGAAPAWAVSSGSGIHLQQDVNVMVCEADASAAQAFALGPGRQAYLLTIEGSLEKMTGHPMDTAPGTLAMKG